MTDHGDWAERFRAELTDDILPFWRGRVRDPRGGFYGWMDSDGRLDKDADRSAVVNARILWTFSTAARLIDPAFGDTADWACREVEEKFVDHEHGGLYWMVDVQGRAVSDRKQIYAQAFGIYAFSEHYRVTGRIDSLELAKRLFRAIEDHSHDAVHGGYVEALARDWSPLADMRLSDKDLNSPKSMNTHLHVLESYTNLLRVWRDPNLAARLKELVALVTDRILADGHFRLFFDSDWRPLSDRVSFGHDIEGSWLIVEAAEATGDAALISRARQVAVAMARAVLAGGVNVDGSLYFEADGTGRIVDATRHWWVQAEAVIGFTNAWQLSGDRRFLDAAQRTWNYIDAKMIDRIHGEWRAKLRPDGTALATAEDPDAVLVGPWKCPYHNARLCYEMIGRLGQQARKRAL